MTPNNLERFLEAQETSYETALEEIRSGHKRSHWMWYIFPQVHGLGFSPTAQRYAIQGADEAEAYLKHPVLGKRLLEISNALMDIPNDDPTSVFGYPDDLKLKSSMTLFGTVQPENPLFQQVLDKFYHGTKDAKTLQLLGN
ncbi:MAG TPA: DUF1810 domain-containing protein [Mucilaginibacter sp.]|jgi:uncharacterized protein (DUF1810 family)|nr:DUF1810 domain-containing protein [Mucilaginibacter sp.]